ncbi:unnamed protein product [Cylindrotheca closterium]|uniref:Cyclin N-terminal domain-containing protein n=1 Tax=Cylindrotheca closterium TaxID=2856 RepID=A0AAD2G0T5_9STRA|nr:unnamed protein product [Cylindrotheca closterium]
MPSSLPTIISHESIRKPSVEDGFERPLEITTNAASVRPRRGSASGSMTPTETPRRPKRRGSASGSMNTVSYAPEITSSGMSSRRPRRGSASGSTNPISSATGSKTGYKREIAALEFLLGIPMKAERDIVHQGWLQQNGMVDMKRNNKKADDAAATPVARSGSGDIRSGNGDMPPLVGHHGRWWEKWVGNPSKQMDPSRSSRIEEEELEQPNQFDESLRSATFRNRHQVVSMVHAPGRRLEGDDAIRIEMPKEIKKSSGQRHIARIAAKREWELEIAHGIDNAALRSSASNASDARKDHPPLLDGRIFFSAAGSYPCEVFSIIRYEPKKEEAARRRKKLEARGGGGSEFIVPARDWRGISYRALLPARKQGKHRSRSNDNSLMLFDRFQNHHDPLENKRSTNETASTGSETLEESDDTDDEPDTYVPGLLDDPEMVLGRHRNVMIGDRSTGCIVASTIQFVQPTLLKSNLNKQFRERFDGWEPPKVQRPFIGAQIVDGVYTLKEDDGHGASQSLAIESGSNISSSTGSQRKRQGSMSSMPGVDSSEIIRMPPSLTLSKIRSLKLQALRAAVKARLEISTVALAIVYFERLCLDCRIDKTNRRLSFAACLLLAVKINESHVGLVMTHEDRSGASSSKALAANRIQSLYRPTKKSNNMFSSLLEFFTQEWEISLKHLFSAEWGVFAALQFRLHAKPSQVAFHYRRLLKSLGWNPRQYLGGEMFSFWQTALAHEEYLRQERQVRIEMRQQAKEKEELMQLQREMGRLETIDDAGIETIIEKDVDKETEKEQEKETPQLATPNSLPSKRQSNSLEPKKQIRRGLSLLNRFGPGTKPTKRSLSTDRVSQSDELGLENDNLTTRKLPLSTSVPMLSSLLPGDGRADDVDTTSAAVAKRYSNTDNTAKSLEPDHLGRGDFCKASIHQLFQQTFADSANEQEGQIVGQLSWDLMYQTLSEDLFVFVVTTDDSTRVAGCFIFSRLALSEQTNIISFLLSPMAVQTTHQKRGIRQDLLRFAMDALKKREPNIDLLATYGDPNYYSNVEFQLVTTAVIPAPLPLSVPKGWLVAGTAFAPKGYFIDTGTKLFCRAALNKKELWSRRHPT